MAKRGRKPGFVMTDAHRVKIQNSNIITALIDHALGKREMSSTQVAAGLGLAHKVLPNLQAVTLAGDADNPLTIVSKDQRDASVNAALRANR
jgi:hypothetical protein